MIPVIIIVLLAVLWAGSSVAIRISLEAMPPFILFASAYGLASGLCLIASAIRSPRPTIMASDIITLIFNGFVRMAFYSFCFIKAQNLTSIGRVAALIGIGAILGPLLAIILRREMPHWSFGLAFLMGIGGIYCLMWPFLMLPEQITAFYWCLAASFAGLVSIFMGQLRPIKGDALAASGWEFMIAGMTMTIFAIIESENLYPNDIQTHHYFWFIWLLFGGLTLFTILLSDVGLPLRNFYLQSCFAVLPVLTMAVGLIVLGEVPSLSDWLGAALMTGAALIICLSGLFKNKAMKVALARVMRGN